MTPLFPANPGTVLLVATRKGKSKADVWRAVIVGWQYVQGSQAFPVCCCNPEGRVGRRAIATNEGVTDLTDRLLYADEATWLAASQLPEPASSADHKPVAVAESPLGTVAHTTAYSVAEEYSDNEEPLHTGPNVGASRAFGWDDITWSKPNQALTNKSFWASESRGVIFTVPGGHPRPVTALIAKITRDEFMALKKDKAYRLIDESSVGGTSALEAAQSTEVEDDDDDFSDML